MDKLMPCPFCGNPVEEKRRPRNPYARCVTQDCMGGKLPLISLDLPEDIERWNRRALPEGMTLVPLEITAESGHKAGMIGEFEERVTLQCDVCEGDGQSIAEDGPCANCEGAGEYSLIVPVSWTTIKAIHRRIVELQRMEAGHG